MTVIVNDAIMATFLRSMLGLSDVTLRGERTVWLIGRHVTPPA